MIVKKEVEIKIDLLNCPFCTAKEKNLHMICNSIAGQESYNIKCMICGATGPVCTSRTYTCLAWNRRDDITLRDDSCLN